MDHKIFADIITYTKENTNMYKHNTRAYGALCLWLREHLPN